MNLGRGEFLAPIQTSPAPPPASYTRIISTGSFPEVKGPERGVTHPPPSNADTEERVELRLLPLPACIYVIYSIYLKLHRENKYVFNAD